MLLNSRQFVSELLVVAGSPQILNNDIIINNKSIYLSTKGYHCTSFVSPLPLSVVPRKFVACSSPLSVVTVLQVHMYLGTYHVAPRYLIILLITRYRSGYPGTHGDLRVPGHL